jgi:hypothetical protein
MCEWVDGWLSRCVDVWMSKWVDKLMGYKVNNYELSHNLRDELINSSTHSHINLFTQMGV